MHHHNQTLADIEREQTPSAWTILAALVCIAAGLYLSLAFAFSL